MDEIIAAIHKLFYCKAVKCSLLA